jgi:uracil-DNA glycosylase family 4
MVLVAESPGEVEVWKEQPLIGPTGQLVRRRFDQLGIHEDEVHLTNAIACIPHQDKSHDAMTQAMHCCRPRLIKELEYVKDNTVLHACGAAALHSIIRVHTVKQNVGIITRGADEFSRFRVVTNWHPTHAFMRSPYYRPVFNAYLQRAWDLATDKIKPWQWPEFDVGVTERTIPHLEAINEQRGPVAFDVENIPSKDILTCLGVSDGEHTVTVPWHSYETLKYGSIKGLDQYGAQGKRIKELIKEILETHEVVAHNAMYDIKEARNIGINITKWFDTLLAHAVLYQPLPHNLEDITLQYYHCERWKSDFKVSPDAKGLDVYFQRPYRELSIYNSKDTLTTRLLRDALGAELDRFHRGWELYETYHREAHIAHKASERGLLIDRDILESYGERFTCNFNEVRTEIVNFAQQHGFDVEFNPNSDDQMRDLIFDTLGAPVKNRTDSGKAALDAKSRAQVLAATEDKRVAWVLRKTAELKKWGKLKNTYIDGLRRQLGEDNIFHPEFRVYSAVSGRWGSFLHTIPKPVYEDGKVKIPAMRDMFVARPGHWIVEADQAQFELRIVGLLAGDLKMIEAVEQGLDLHSQNSMDLWGDAKKEHRTFAKNFVFATNYGPTDMRASAQSNWENLRKVFPDLTLLRVYGAVRKWFESHHWIATWREQTLKEVMRDDYVREPFSGRTRQFYGRVKDTEAYNHKIQTCAAWIISQALAKIESQLDWDVHSLATQWHDALILETQKPVEAAQLLQEAMDMDLDYNGLTMKFRCDWKIGRGLGQLTECSTLDEVRDLTSSC